MLEISLHHGQKPVGKLEFLKVKRKKALDVSLERFSNFYITGWWTFSLELSQTVWIGFDVIYILFHNRIIHVLSFSATLTAAQSQVHGFPIYTIYVPFTSRLHSCYGLIFCVPPCCLQHCYNWPKVYAIRYSKAHSGFCITNGQGRIASVVMFQGVWWGLEYPPQKQEVQVSSQENILNS